MSRTPQPLDHCRRTQFPPLEAQLCTFNCVDNYIMLVLYICHLKCYELFNVHPFIIGFSEFCFNLYIVTLGYLWHYVIMMTFWWQQWEKPEFSKEGVHELWQRLLLKKGTQLPTKARVRCYVRLVFYASMAKGLLPLRPFASWCDLYLIFNVVTRFIEKLDGSLYVGYYRTLRQYQITLPYHANTTSQT